jgi:isopenicillin-N N-acyltransferase-like protein
MRPRGGDDEVVMFTLTGCLGMTGLTADGVGVTINNLSSTDGQVGVVWPALVRAMLASGSAAAARDRLLATRLSSGHHYMMGDGQRVLRRRDQRQAEGRHPGRRARGPPAHQPLLRPGAAPLRESAALSARPSAASRSRLTLYVQQRPNDLQGVWTLLSSHEGYPRSLCSHIDAGDPSAAKTCGRMVLQLATGEVWSSAGCGQDNPPVRLQLSRWRGRPQPPPTSA